ncbi:MAG TPA: hypothetical protein VHG89_10985 [Verrucomicrobiae bacterium]|nr:hypothetical protein [Verrucomicrobiae bacterium]
MRCKFPPLAPEFSFAPRDFLKNQRTFVGIGEAGCPGMKTHLFETFRRMIESLPVNGILLAATLERRMIEEDLSQRRIPFTEETVSVFNFCRFLQAATLGNGIFPTVLPLPHFPFYRKTINRLIEAGKLPQNARKQFDTTFFSGVFNPQWLFGFNNENAGNRVTRFAA